MNRVRALLLTAYLILSLVGSAIYVQSVNNMVQFTEADQVFPGAVNASKIEIPRFKGENQSYIVKCTFRFDNPSKVTIILRAFTFELSVDNGKPGNPFDGDRLREEWVGQGSNSSGDAGPRISPGGFYEGAFSFRVSASDSSVLNHTNADGRYVVVLYNISMSYGFVGTSLSRPVWLPWMVREVEPVG